nr:isopeptide-forming domain-containing fimbrial protein [Methanobacterium aggregans]
MALCGTAAAADTPNNNTNFNSSANLTNSSFNDQTNNNISNVSTDNITISGNVTRCDNGLPFSGVTITANSLNGNFIGTTTTDASGVYTLNFSSDERNFMVTASHTGHVPETKDVAVTPETNNSSENLVGIANFKLGPIPVATVTAPNSTFINETFNFQVSFKDGGDVTGYGPYIELITPSGVTLNPSTVTYLGSSVTVTDNGIFPASGILVDALTGLTVTGTPGSHLLIIQYPLGSFTTLEPEAVLSLNATIDGNATLGVPLNITAYPVFRYGATPTGTTPLRGVSSTAPVTPTVIKLTKTSDAHEQETATGSNYPVIYTLTVDIANGQTVNNVTLVDNIPGNLQFVQIVDPAGGTVIQQPSKTTPGGKIIINFGSITGVLGPDRVVKYTVFAPKFDNTSNYVLDPLTGATSNATNNATVNGTYLSNTVSSSDSYTLKLKSLAVQKGVTDTTNSTNHKPLDILKYTVNFQVSDFFSLKELVINDTLGDGQTFLQDASHTPTLTLHLPSGTYNLNFNLLDSSVFQMIHNSTTGETYLVFNVSQLLINNGFVDGVLEGGNYTGVNNGATQGSINFWSQINVNYENPSNHPIVSNDYIKNSVTGSAKLIENNSSVSDGSGTRIQIVSPTAEKSIYKINGSDPIAGNHVKPGDTVTFSLTVSVPTTNLENFSITDYLPLPFLWTIGFSNGQAPVAQGTLPSTGQWSLAGDDTFSALTGKIPTLVVDPVQNTLSFIYGNAYNATQPMSLVHILFTVTATNEPMADSLYLTNLMNIQYNNTFMETFADNKIVSLKTQEPHITITKTANTTTAQGGDTVTYTIKVQNDGHATAYNVNVIDNFKNLFFPNYVQSITGVTATYQNGQSIDITGLGDLFGTGLNFGTLYPIYAANDSAHVNMDTIIITYQALLGNVYPNQSLTNTANVTNYTSSPLTGSPNYVTNPADYSSTATVTTPKPQFTKSYLGSITGISTGNNLTIGEKGRFRLAVTLPGGQITNLKIVDTLPNGLTYLGYYLNTTGPVYVGSLAPISLSQSGNVLTFLFSGTSNTTSGSNNIFYIDLDFIVANSTSNPAHNPGNPKTNSATLSWTDPGNSPITKTASVNVVEPQLSVTKSFSPNPVQGGQTVTVTITVKNTGSSTAYNTVITDPLNGTNGSQIFDLTSVAEGTTASGFIYNYSNGVVTYTGGDIAVGQTKTFTFTVKILPDLVIGPRYTNTATANYYSLPWDGTNPDTSSRQYTDSGSAVLRTGNPTIGKNILTSSIHGTTGNLTVGEYVTYRIPVTMPTGVFNNLKIVDTLPNGFQYAGVYVVNTTNFSGVIPIPTVTVSGQSITFLFSGLTNSTTSNNPFYIDLQALVLNQTINNATVPTKTNTVSLTWNENTASPFTATKTATIVEPKLSVSKSVTPTTVDGGDKMTVTLNVTNNGGSPAYNLKLTDVLNSTLFDLTKFSYTPVTGFNISITGNTVNIVAADDTTVINPGQTLQFIFTVNAMKDVPSNSSFINNATIQSFRSLPSSYSESRIYPAVTSNNVTISTVAPSASKTINSTSEPDSTGTNVMIGEVVTYQLNLTVPEGKTINVNLNDILSSKLKYLNGSAQIKRSTGNITATGFNFSQVNVFESIDPTTASNIVFNLGNITYTGTDGLHNGTITIIFNAVVLNSQNQRGDTIPNSLTFTYQNATGQTSSSTTSSPALNVIVPQLFSSKQVLSPVPSASVEGGQNVTFRVQVQNNNITNGAPAYNLQVLDLLLPDYTGLDYNHLIITPSNAGIVFHDFSTAGVLNITVDRLMPGEYLNITYNATVNPNVKYGDQNVTNTVNFTGTTLPGDHGTNNATPGNPGADDGKRTGDPFQGALNNLYSNSTATVTARKPTISKVIVGSSQSSVGGQVHYRITITLPAGVTEDMYLTDVMATGTSYVTGSATLTPSTGVLTEFTVPQVSGTGTLNFSIGWINATQSGTLYLDYYGLVGNVLSNQNGVTLTNTANMYFADPQNPGNYLNGGSSQATATVVEPNLQVTKTASKTNLNTGEQFTYTVTVKHTAASTADAYDVQVVDTLPSGLTYVPGSEVLPPTWSLTVSGNTLTFSSPLLTLFDGTAIFTFNCSVNNGYNLAGMNLTNTAVLTYASGPSDNPNRRTGSDGPSGPGVLNDYYTTGNVQVHVLGADLVVKKVGPSSLNAGEPLNYTITVINKGPDTAVNAVLNDTFLVPWFNRLVNPQYSINGGSWINIPSGSWILNLGDIMPGAENNVTIAVRSTLTSSAPSGQINNTATVTSTTADPLPSDNTSTVLTDVGNKDSLIITKTGPSGPLTAGKDSITYTLTIHNNGPSDSSQLTISDNVPGVLTNVEYFVVGYSTVWTEWNNHLLWLQPLTAGQDLVIQIRGYILPNATSSSGEELNSIVATNTANVTSPTDPAGSSDEWNTTVVAQVDVFVEKTGTPNPVIPGGIVTYTINLGNRGPSTAFGVTLNDNVPSVILNPEFSLDNGITWNQWIGSILLGNMEPNQNLTVLLRGTENATNHDNFTNTATVSSQTTDPNTEDKTSSYEIRVKTADIEVKKDASNSTPNYTQNVTFTITVTNYGPDEATGVAVTDLLPDGLKFISSSVDQGFYNSTSGVWTVGTLGNGLNSTLTILAQVFKTGNLTNVVNKTAENEYDPNPENNNDSKTLNVPAAAALSITKTASPLKLHIHETVIFTLIVQNHGPDTAVKVYVEDKLPKGLKYLSSTANYGSYDPNTGIWTIGDLPNGTTAVLTIKCGVEVLGSLENHAHAYSETYDPSLYPTSSVAGVIVTPQPVPNNPDKNGKTVPMKPTAVPLAALLLAVLMIVAGFGFKKR